MAPFRRETEAALSLLSNEQLVAYIDEAREAGDLEMAKRASGVLAWANLRLVTTWVAAKFPFNSPDIEDVVANVLESVIKSVFDGRSMGEFGAWLKTITGRRIADFYRAAEGKPPLGHLPDGDPENDEAPEPGSEDGGFVAVEIREAAGRVLETRSPEHQGVIRLYGPNEMGYMALGAAETVEKLEALHPGCEMTETNVHQIWKRFKRDVHGELGLGGS